MLIIAYFQYFINVDSLNFTEICKLSKSRNLKNCSTKPQLRFKFYETSKTKLALGKVFHLCLLILCGLRSPLFFFTVVQNLHKKEQQANKFGIHNKQWTACGSFLLALLLLVNSLRKLHCFLLGMEAGTLSQVLSPSHFLHVVPLFQWIHSRAATTTEPQMRLAMRIFEDCCYLEILIVKCEWVAILDENASEQAVAFYFTFSLPFQFIPNYSK